MACSGAGYEIMRWAEAVKAETGKDLKIKLVDKAAMDRSGAVAQGLSAINTYIGDKQDPADYARMVSNDLMGITRCRSGRRLRTAFVTTAPTPSRKVCRP